MTFLSWVAGWNLTQREYGDKGKKYTIFYAAPKPYEVGFISSPSAEGRMNQLMMTYKSTQNP